MKTALIAGATGLIGKQVLTLLLHDTYYDKVIALSRKPLEITQDKLENRVVDFDKLEEMNLTADDVFCCLGTTMRQAKTKEAFYKVDFQYPCSIAKQAKLHGASQFFLISALGATKNSSIFYNRVKGEVEEAIAKLDYQSFHVFQPSLLLGLRTDDRSGEKAAIIFYNYLGWLIPKKYQAIDSSKVARAMLALAKENKAGQFVHQSIALQKY